MNRFTLLLAVYLLPLTAFAQHVPELMGHWQGRLQVYPDSKIVLVFELQGSSQSLGGTIQMPDQSDKKLPISKLLVRHDSLFLHIEALQAQFAGKFSIDGKHIIGTWFNKKMQAPLLLYRSAQQPLPVASSVRPQEPTEPLPYRSQDVYFVNKKAGSIKLAGTLTLPDKKGPFSAVLLVSGSGPENRDEAVFGHKPFLVLADYLTRRGFAVLRYDDRGVGRSQGTFKDATTADFTTDALAAIDYLRQRPDIISQQVALAGHSEGGLIGWKAASETGGPNLIISLASPGVSGDSVLLSQLTDLSRARGTDATDIAFGNRMMRAVFAEFRQQPADLPSDQLLSRLTAVVQRYQLEMTLKQAQQQIQFLTTPWMRYYLRLNPADYLARVTCPVLALNGTNDLQVAAAQNLRAIERGLHAAHNSDVTIRILPQLNHFFQTDPKATGQYGAIDETFAPSALQLIGDWLVSHTSK